MRGLSEQIGSMCHSVQQQSGWRRAASALGSLHCSAWCQTARYAMQGGAVARRGFAALCTAPGSKMGSSQGSSVHCFTTVCNRIPKACKWHAVACFTH